MDLEPGVIFGIVAGAAFALIAGTGIAIAAGLYTADRAMRATRGSPAGAYEPRPQPEPRRVIAAVLPGPSPVTRVIAASGEVEAAPSLGLPHIKLGMWVFLASEVLFFSSLILSFLFFRTTGSITRVDTGHLNVPLTALNTFLLLSSSFTVVQAFDAIQDAKAGRFQGMLLATLVLGAIFVSIQAFEWNALFREGITPTADVFGTVFFVLTGFHGMHVIVGLLWLIGLLIAAARGSFSAAANLGVEIFGLYWHFVDIVWIVLFTIIYLI